MKAYFSFDRNVLYTIKATNDKLRWRDDAQ